VLQERRDAVHVLRKRMFTCDEISDRPPQALINGHDGCGLHQVLYGRNRLRMAGVKIEVTVSHGKDGSATTASQASLAVEGMLRVVCRIPNRFIGAADRALKRSKN